MLKKIKIFNTRIDEYKNNELLSKINDAIDGKIQIIVSYATADILNKIKSHNGLEDLLNYFDIIHPDGIGVYIASKILYCRKGFNNRFTGSDFYPYLIQEGLKNNWSFFFFGDTEATLSKLKANTNLNIKGYFSGYNFNPELIIQDINSANPEILVVGLGFPNQEKWIIKNKNNLNANVILAVGDGIKVFAGTKKRGGKFIQILGLEWLVRLINNPSLYWKRYLIGIPLFLFRVIKYKLSLVFK